MAPPLLPSTTTFFMGEPPMWCVRGHQLSIASVKIRKARAALARTETVFLTGSTSGTAALGRLALLCDVCVSAISLSLLYLGLEGLQGVAPAAVEVRPETRKAPRVQPVVPPCPDCLIRHKLCLLQHAKVLRHRWPAYGKSSRQFAHRQS